MAKVPSTLLRPMARNWIGPACPNPQISGDIAEIGPTLVDPCIVDDDRLPRKCGRAARAGLGRRDQSVEAVAGATINAGPGSDSQCAIRFVQQHDRAQCVRHSALNTFAQSIEGLGLARANSDALEHKPL